MAVCPSWLVAQCNAASRHCLHVARSAQHGFRGGLAVALGLGTGAVVNVAAAAIGLSVSLMTFASAASWDRSPLPPPADARRATNNRSQDRSYLSKRNHSTPDNSSRRSLQK